MSERARVPGMRKTFTGEQVARYRRVFDHFDINKNGTLEARELAAVAKVMGYRMQKQQVMAILANLDLDVNGSLSFEEFLDAMPGNLNSLTETDHSRAEVRHIFQEYDKDANGYITKDEAHQVLSKELGFTEEKTVELMKQFDQNKDGKLSYEEFVNFYIKVRERKEALDKAFHQFDRDSKGYVTVEDAKRILGGMMFTAEEVEALVRTHDTNQDGKLQYEEFVNFWSA